MKKILSMLFVGLLFISCNNSSDDNNYNGEVPIILSSQLSIERQKLSRQTTQIAAGQQVSFFITEAGVPSQLAYTNAMLTADGDGNFAITYQEQQNAVLYYPLYAAGSDFYGIHPYANIPFGSSYNFNIIPDQSAIRNFLNSDLLYVKRGPVMPSRQPVQLVFDHKLAKVNFVVIEGDGTDLTGLSRVEIIGARQQAVINTLTGEITPSEDVTTANVVAYGLQDGYATVESNQVSDISAIIVPQTFSANQPLFRLTINGVNYVYTPTSQTEFAVGTSHTFRLTLTNAGIVVTSSINPWTAAEDQEGEGIIE